MRLVIDIMPTDDRLGFTNRWYPSVHRHREPTDIAGLFAASALDYLLTKIEAFRGRGSADPLASHDLEDIVVLTRGHPTLMTELRSGADIRHVEARRFLTEFSAGPDARALLLAHTEGDAASQAEAEALHTAWHALR